MKITTINTRNKTLFRNVAEGVVFTDNMIDYYIKIPLCIDFHENEYNSVNLATGDLEGFMEGAEVYIVEAELKVMLK
jgi:hypothetical protein